MSFKNKTRLFVAAAAITLTVSIASPAMAGLYGGGVSGSCGWIEVVYFLALGMEPSYCIHN